MRPDLGSFEVGTYYRRNTDGEWVEYIGIATTADAEQVGIFRFPEPGGGGACILATERSFESGERFTSAGDALTDDARNE